MIIVLDTNILVVSLTSRSPYHKIFTALKNNKYTLAVSTEIKMEYQEIISDKYSSRIAHELLNLLSELPNVLFTTVYYHWQLISADKEDNKFVDCAIASAADYVVTEDNHFNILRQIDFPKVNLADINAFSNIIA
jgi:putative PIN family toxin of toxin-antitoxin system